MVQAFWDDVAWAARRVWRSRGFSGLVVLILIIVGTIFVGRHEAQLSAEAERALPGPLKWP